MSYYAKRALAVVAAVINPRTDPYLLPFVVDANGYGLNPTGGAVIDYGTIASIDFTKKPYKKFTEMRISAQVNNFGVAMKLNVKDLTTGLDLFPDLVTPLLVGAQAVDSPWVPFVPPDVNHQFVSRASNAGGGPMTIYRHVLQFA